MTLTMAMTSGLTCGLCSAGEARSEAGERPSVVIERSNDPALFVGLALHGVEDGRSLDADNDAVYVAAGAKRQRHSEECDLQRFVEGDCNLVRPAESEESLIVLPVSELRTGSPRRRKAAGARDAGTSQTTLPVCRGFYAGATSHDAAGLERGPDGIMIEDMGFIDNLMLHGGVVNRGGTVAVGDAALDRLYTDMTA